MEYIPRSVLEQFLAFLPFAAALLDNEIKVILANQQFEELMGVSSHIIGEKNRKELFSANPNILNIIETSLKNKTSCSQAKSMLYRWEKNPLPIEISASPAGNISGIPEASLILIIKDKSTFAEIENREEQTEMMRNMGSFSQWLIHEIRNPLGSIKGAAQMIAREEGISDYSKEFLDIILSEVSRLSRLSGELSFFMSNKQASVENINIHAVVDRVLNMMSLDSSFNNIIFKREYDPSLPGIRGNEDELIQLFQNVLKNAAESQEHKGEIRVRTRYIRIASPKNPDSLKYGHIAVEIIDSGNGIPAEIREKLFIPFFTTKKEGTGLGLAISLKIVTKHDGSIEFEERNESGTLCRVTLPFPKA